MSLQSVHIRVCESGATKPLPVRLRITDSAGVYYAPLGRLTHPPATPNADVGGNVWIDGEAWAAIDGACEILLPPGELRVRIVRGPEFDAIDTAVSLAAGKLSLRFEMTRRVDPAANGWHAGDIASYLMTPHAALLEGASEGLAVVNLLVRECEGALANIVAFSGQKPLLEQPGTMVAVNSRNDSSLGQLCLLHCHRTIYPLRFQLEADAVWTLDDWCQQCHRIRQRPGLVIAENLFSHWNETADEMTALLVLGRIDALMLEPGHSLEPWFSLLDAGLRVPLVAGSRRENAQTPLGSWRTYAQTALGEPLTYASWIEAIRAGRTWVTSGPILSMTQTSEPRQLHAESLDEGRLEIIANRKVLASRTGPGTLDVTLPPDATWVIAQVTDATGTLRAVTSPIFFEGSHSAKEVIIARLRASQKWFEAVSTASPKQRVHLLETLQAALAEMDPS